MAEESLLVYLSNRAATSVLLPFLPSIVAMALAYVILSLRIVILALCEAYNVQGSISDAMKDLSQYIGMVPVTQELSLRDCVQHSMIASLRADL